MPARYGRHPSTGRSWTSGSSASSLTIRSTTASNSSSRSCTYLYSDIERTPNRDDTARIVAAPMPCSSTSSSVAVTIRSSDRPRPGRLQAQQLPGNWSNVLPSFESDAQGTATRKASGTVLSALAPVLPELWGGSADLAESDNTTMDGADSFVPPDRQIKEWRGGPFGRTLHLGIREADKGGHFAAWEEPELFATEVRAAFRPLRQQQRAPGFDGDHPAHDHINEKVQELAGARIRGMAR